MDELYFEMRTVIGRFIANLTLVIASLSPSSQVIPGHPLSLFPSTSVSFLPVKYFPLGSQVL